MRREKIIIIFRLHKIKKMLKTSFFEFVGAAAPQPAIPEDDEDEEVDEEGKKKCFYLIFLIF